MTVNIINANSTGLINNLGSGVFISQSTTHYNILCGNTGNGISNISPGTISEVLTSNGASANASFQILSAPPFSSFFSVYLTTPAPNVTGDGTKYTILFDGIVANSGSSYNSLTGKFTAPASADYLFGWKASTSTSGTYLSSFSNILINSSYLYTSQSSYVPFANTNTQCVGIVLISLTSGDTVAISTTATSVTSAKNVTVLGNAVNRQNSFWGFRIT